MKNFVFKFFFLFVSTPSTTTSVQELGEKKEDWSPLSYIAVFLLFVLLLTHLYLLSPFPPPPQSSGSAMTPFCRSPPITLLQKEEAEHEQGAAP